ncbi:DUF2927 domain-containing protein [Celeribacter arenosi]|uniref:DUF2927 domain-containing protein n=1 Tax=Celeribacter arenosi TaxID=792649 RepID=A0ABP7KFU7_9RHOB
MIFARAICALLALTSLSACVPSTREVPANGAALDLPAMAQFRAFTPAPVTRSNAELARDFIDLSFNLENGVALERFTRIEGPITLRVLDAGRIPTLRADLDGLRMRLAREAGIDITVVASDRPAVISIETVPARELAQRAPNTACIVAPNVGSWSEFRSARRAAVSWTRVTERRQLAIFLPEDSPPQEARDCLHEELAQALGPLNDLYRLTDSVFNDDNMHSVLTGFDMLMLRVTYAPDLRNGMSRAEVARALPTVLARLNPRGEGMGSRRISPTPQSWVEDIQRAMSGTATDQRRAAAARALRYAQDRGWDDGRIAFAWFLIGRLSLGADRDAAREALLSAKALYARHGGDIQESHVAMQLAALALAERDYADAERTAARAIPAARNAQNAALLATLGLTQAAALDGLGRPGEARAVRLDSLGWARYGFGSDAAIRARVVEISGLAR